jgi:GntR family transcriptional regulator
MLRSMVDRTAPEPLWQQLTDIRRRIADGTYPPRTAIPSISELAAEFGLCDVTVKKALSHLKEQAVLTGTPGRGTFVARRD